MNVNAKIEDFLNPDELEGLARYMKRITHEDAYRHTDVGDGEEQQKAQAYRFLTAIGKLENYLAEIGF